MSGKQEREKRRAQRLEQEGAAEGQARRKRLVQLGSAAAFLAIAIVAVLIVVSQSQTDGGDSSLEFVEETNAELREIPQQGLVLGEPGAKVTLAEFGDLQCPACKAVAEEVIPDVIESKVRSGEAKISFHNFTILGPESELAAAAAVAAGEQGRGWNFIELFYRNQGFEHSGYITDDFLTSIAEGAGVSDIERWNRDRESRQAKAQVARDNAQASRLGFGGTPSFAIEGPSTNGLETITPGGAPDIEAAIEQAG